MPKMVTNNVIAAKLDNLTELVKAHITKDEKFQSDVEGFINGNGKPGLKTRMDRIEQVELSRKWQWKTIWTTLAATIIGLVAKVLFG